MADQSVPILTKAPEEKTDEVTEALTELTKSTEFLGKTLDITKPLEKMTEAGAKSMKLMQDTFLGDIGFVTGPLKEVGGIFKSMGSGIGSLFGKKKKVAPKRSAMLKESPESVYITDTLMKAGDDENFLDKFKGLLPLLLGGGAAAGLAKLGPLLMKGGAIGMIIGSLVWMAIDGFKAYAMSGEWGVSKAAAVIGGILAGTGSGWKNAFLGMGKWAIMGAGIGLLAGGPVGALIGGLVGAALGGIMGFIGGEKMAKGLDAVGKWYVDTWKKIFGAFKKVFDVIKVPFIMVYDEVIGLVDKIKTIFSSDENVAKKIGRVLFELVTFGPKLMIKWAIGVFNGVKSVFLDLFTDQTKPDGSIKKGLVKQYWQILKEVFTLVGGKVKTMFLGMVSGAVSIGSDIKDGIVSAVKMIPQLLIDALNGAFDLLSGFWSGLSETLKSIPIVGDIFNFFDEHIFQPIGSIFTSIKDGIINFIEDPIGFGKSIIQDLLESVKEIFTGIKEGFVSFASDPMGSIGEGIDNAKTGLGNVWDWVTSKVTDKIDDGIVKSDGSVIKTNPQDTIIATKNPVAFADKESSSMRSNINSPVGNANGNLESLIRELISKQMQPQANNTMLQNITSRYNPQAIMANLTTEVF